MSHTIKLTFQGGRQNHIVNPLNKLDGRVYDTREEACEAIYSALYDVISGENGCEMIPQPDMTLGMVYECSRDGINASSPINANDKPYSREDAMTVDLGDASVTMRETTSDDGLDARVDYVASNNDGDIVGYYQFVEDDTLMDKYLSEVHDYILREGYASEDGVSASVEEITEDEENA